ncbi:MAG: NADH-dependent [FeFe] hydrogenase, group A6 [Eubacteriales bacterium]|nr:NADH-dependent [FeFe] hydrogenase, group A6 [Eubacteriales bacterium]
MEAAKANKILIPNLCFLECVNQIGSCRICVVEVEGAKTLQASCMTKVKEGMVVYTNSAKVRKARKILYELILSDHPKDCLNCSRNQNCELQELGELLQVKENRFEGQRSNSSVDDFSASIIRDTSKCILCRRCVSVCNDIQDIGVLNAQNRGFNTIVAPAAGLPLTEVNCILCGQCTAVCPVGALQEKDSTEDVSAALNDKNKRVIIQTAPAIRAALGELFDYEPGTLVTGKMVTALKDMGFDDVFDTNFTADLTIVEEGSELLQRLTKALTGGEAVLPMITSCSPGWIKYIEHNFPDELGHLSTCKSPHMMLGALVKTYYANKLGISPKDMYVVSVMPCTAKKFEITRPEMDVDGVPGVDAVLTTRELGRMIKDYGIQFTELKDSRFDNPLGFSTGAADIFATTGGVMEAALRTVYELVTGRELPMEGLRVAPIRGLEHIKTAELKIENPIAKYAFLDGVIVKVAVTSGMKGAKQLMNEVAKGESPYHFIEIMGCPGGCISGGGQPRLTDDTIRMKRAHAIWKEDEGKRYRKSHENPFIAKIYEDFLKEPLGHKSHELLHTTYTKRGTYNEYIK